MKSKYRNEVFEIRRGEKLTGEACAIAKSNGLIKALSADGDIIGNGVRRRE